MNNRGRDHNTLLTLPEFKTLKKRIYQISKVENIKITSMEIYFTLDKKDQAGNVAIKDKTKEPTEIKNKIKELIKQKTIILIIIFYFVFISNTLKWIHLLGSSIWLYFFSKILFIINFINI